MLALTRRSGESLRIGDTTLTVLRVVGGKIRIGIDAPREVAVRRLTSEGVTRLEGATRVKTVAAGPAAPPTV